MHDKIVNYIRKYVRVSELLDESGYISAEYISERFNVDYKTAVKVANTLDLCWVMTGKI
jgi:hypothetical protein